LVILFILELQFEEEEILFPHFREYKKTSYLCFEALVAAEAVVSGIISFSDLYTEFRCVTLHLEIQW